MAALSNVEIWRPLLIGVVIYMLVFGGFKRRACILCMLFALLIGAQVTGLLKTAIDRQRPNKVQSVRMVQLNRTLPDFMTLFHPPTTRYSDASGRTRSR